MPIVTSSRQFNAWYAQQRRKSRLNPIAQAITKVFIDINGTNAYYSLSAPWVAPNDFEIEVDIETTNTGTMIIIGLSTVTSQLLALNNGQIVFNTLGGSITTGSVNVTDGALHRLKIKSVSGTATINVDGVLVSSGAVGYFSCDLFGQYTGNTFFDGIISDVKLTDITTPANSLAFGLDNLTGNTEVNNGVTLTYQNITEVISVRDTYTLSNGGTQWVSSLRTIDNQVDTVGYDIILLAGQSNMVGYSGPVSSTLDTVDQRILQFGHRTQSVLIASDPLDHPDLRINEVGLGSTLARQYLATIPNNRGVIVIPVAQGSSGFGNGYWRNGGAGYVNAVSGANLALTYKGLNNKIVAMAWHQGESDSAMTEIQYSADLDLLIAGFRADINGASSNIPFIVGEVPTWSNGYGSGVAAALLDTPARVTNTGYVSTSDLNSNGDNIHFDAPSLRTMGVRYFNEL